MSAKVEKLAGAQTIKGLTAKINELVEVLNNMPAPRDRGPKSTRDMTEDDARRLMIGDLKEVPHKKAAEELGLSYGQVYSARGGYTFKGIYDEARKLNKK